MRRTVEGRRDRLVLARDAGLGRASVLSALAGTMVAYGTTVVLLALVSGIAARSSSDGNSLTTYDWRRIGIGAAIAVAVVLLVSYLFGGYVAGRMARRAGSVNGFLVFVLGLVVVAVAAAIVMPALFWLKRGTAAQLGKRRPATPSVRGPRRQSAGSSR